MIIQDIYLDRYDWSIRVYYSVNTVYTKDIIKDLVDINCPEDILLDIKDFISNIDYNKGVTYSNFDTKSSIVVIGPTTSAEQFQDTFDHEKGHLVMHIASAYNIHPLSETYQYIAGFIGRKLFAVAKKFLCNNCRHHLNDLFKEER